MLSFYVVWADVNVENKENWKWLIELLVEDIGVIKGAGLTFVSDQHKLCILLTLTSVYIMSMYIFMHCRSFYAIGHC